VRVLGLDVGSKTIGVAVSDDLMLAAHPVTTLARRGMAKDTAAVLELARAREAAALVVGLPYDLEGRVGPRAERVLAFVACLEAAPDALPVETYDERYSTIIAEEHLRAASVSARRRKAVIDQAAAVVILQGWLDEHARPGAAP
jgi:putative Holliday junction resolvase